MWFTMSPGTILCWRTVSALVRRLGRVVLLGDTPTPTRQNLAPGVVSNSVAILGIHGTTTPDVASDFNPGRGAR